MKGEGRPDTMMAGFLLGFGLHVFQLGFFLVSEALPYEGKTAGPALMFGVAPLFVGATQVSYLLPAWIVLYWRGNREIAKGVVLAGAITLRINAACASVVLSR